MNKRKKKKNQIKNCNICEKTFATCNGYYLHNKKYHYEEEELKLNKVKLDGQILNFKKTKQKTVDTNEQNVKTEDTNKRKKKKTVIKNCDICQIPFVYNMAFNQHNRMVHGNNQITQSNTEEKTPVTKLKKVKKIKKKKNEESENVDENFNLMNLILSIKLPPRPPSTCNPEDYPEMYRR